MKQIFCLATTVLLYLNLSLVVFAEVSLFEKTPLLHGFGDLKDYTLISTDHKFIGPGVSERRYILDAEPLGRLLLVHRLEEERVVKQFLYSAEQIIINVGKNESLEAVQKALRNVGFPCVRPFEYSRFIYVNKAVQTAEELYQLANGVRDVLNEGCIVEFDPIVFRNGVVPSDPGYSNQWHHEEVNSEEAWKVTTGSSSIVVAVVDGGIFPNLEEFEGRLTEGANILHMLGLEEEPPEPLDDVGHGTAVSGLLAANANNGVLGAGLDWHCQIMPIRVSQHNSTTSTPVAAGIDYAVAHGARVINVSWGTGPSSVLRTAVENAAANGAVVVAALGNFGLDGTWLPAKAAEAIAVGATMRNGLRAEWSNWGDGIDIVAPGEALYSVGAHDVGNMIEGTSGSSPLVAGAAALLLSVNPDLNWRGIRDLLAAGAIDQTGDPLDLPGWDEYYGWGRLNIFNSLLLAKVKLNIEYVTEKRIRLYWRVPPNLDDRVAYLVERSVNLEDWELLMNPDIITKEVENESIAELILDLTSRCPGSEFYRVLVDLRIEEG